MLCGISGSLSSLVDALALGIREGEEKDAGDCTGSPVFACVLLDEEATHWRSHGKSTPGPVVRGLGFSLHLFFTLAGLTGNPERGRKMILAVNAA